MCNRAVRKDTHAGLQRIPSADVPSCDQKRHTRWRATNSAADASSCRQKRQTQDSATASNLIMQTILSSSHTAAPHVSAAAGKRRDLLPRNGSP